MQRNILSLLIAIFCFCHLFAASTDKGLIIYSAISKYKSAQDIAGLNHKQPDSIFYSVYFEQFFSISYFTVTSRLYPDDFEFSELDQYSLNFTDSGFSIRKNILCNTKYKIFFQQRSLINTGESVMRWGFKCNKYYTVGHINDTTYYFITKELPKGAGFKIVSDIEGCILEIESNLYKIFPVLIDPSVNYNTKKLRETPKSIQTIESSNKLWIESPVGEIIKGRPFPKFYATNIKKETLTNQDLAPRQGSCSIILLLDFIKYCKEYGTLLAGHYKNSDNQSKDIIDALDKVALERKTKYFVMTQDYWENIKDLQYDNLQIISNAMEWYERIMVFSYPLFVVVDDKGIVKDFISLFDVDHSISYVDGFTKLINQCVVK